LAVGGVVLNIDYFGGRKTKGDMTELLLIAVLFQL